MTAKLFMEFRDHSTQAYLCVRVCVRVRVRVRVCVCVREKKTCMSVAQPFSPHFIFLLENLPPSRSIIISSISLKSSLLDVGLHA